MAKTENRRNQVGVRLESGEMAQIEAMAKREGRTNADVARRLLMDALLRAEGSSPQGIYRLTDEEGAAVTAYGLLRTACSDGNYSSPTTRASMSRTRSTRPASTRASHGKIRSRSAAAPRSDPDSASSAPSAHRIVSSGRSPRRIVYVTGAARCLFTFRVRRPDR